MNFLTFLKLSKTLKSTVFSICSIIYSDIAIIEVISLEFSDTCSEFAFVNKYTFVHSSIFSEMGKFQCRRLETHKLIKKLFSHYEGGTPLQGGCYYGIYSMQSQELPIVLFITRQPFAS